MASTTLPVQDLQGKIALVTGASRGIGQGIAFHLASRGASILGTASSESSLHFIESLEEKLLLTYPDQSPKPKIVGIVADILDPENSPALITKAIQEHFSGKLNILVNNAAVLGSFQIVPDITLANMNHILTGNLIFPILLMKAILPHLQPNSRIVNISSEAVRVIRPALSVYSAAKAGLESLTRTWALELGRYPGMEGTVVNALEPGATNTGIIGPVSDEQRKAFNDELSSTFDVPHPAMAEVGDVVPFVGFLCSEGAGWTTGSVVEVSAGRGKIF